MYTDSQSVICNWDQMYKHFIFYNPKVILLSETRTTNIRLDLCKITTNTNQGNNRYIGLKKKPFKAVSDNMEEEIDRTAFLLLLENINKD